MESPGRRERASDYAEWLAGVIRQHIADAVRAWPPAIESTAPIAERLAAVLFAWEMTGEAVCNADLIELERELLDAWQGAAMRWFDEITKRGV